MKVDWEVARGRGGRALAAVPLLAVVLVVGRGDGFPVSQLSLSTGSAWLASSAVGQLSLIDGTSAELVTQVRVADRRTDLAAAQAGPDAYAVNRSVGAVVRVDGRTHATSPAVRVIPGAAAGLQVFPGSRLLFALDSARGLVNAVDPVSLQVTRQLSMAAAVAEGAGVVDGADRLWVLDQRSGDLVWLDQSAKRSRPSAVAEPARARLVRMGDGAALVDLTARSLQVLDARSGRPTRRGCVDVAADDLSVQVSGSSVAPRLYAVSGRRGVLLVSDVRRGDCDTVVEIARPGAELGVPQEAGGLVFVPNFSTGEVVVVDLGTQREVARPKVLDPGRFELLAKDGLVFYNDPDSERAGVVRLDGSVRPIKKYNPQSPGNGVVRPGGSQGAPPRGAPDDLPKKQPPEEEPSPPRAGPPTGNPPPGQGPRSVAVKIRLAPSAQGLVGDLFQFEVEAVGGGAVESARWTFGDGHSEHGARVKHRWVAAGVFDVYAQVVLTDGRQVVAGPAQMTIRKDGSGDSPPVIESLTYDPPDIWLIGKPITFSAVVTGGEHASWEWTLVRDDGRTAATFKDQKPSIQHTFDTAGRAYTMHLKVTNSLGTASKKAGGLEVLDRLPVTPVITSFSRSPQSPIQGQQVTFSAVVDNGEGFIWNWALLQPGSRVTRTKAIGAASFTTTVDEVGKYQVELTVSDTIHRRNDCSCAQATDTFSVAPNGPPVAVLTVSPSHGAAPLAVTANASASTDDNGIATYQFDFGDGTVMDPQGAPTASHTYQRPGTHTVTVTITDSAGSSNRTSATVSVVDDKAPDVTLTATNLAGSPTVAPTSGNRTLQVSKGLQIQLQANSADGGSGIVRTAIFSDSSSGCNDPKSEIHSIEQGLNAPRISNSNQVNLNHTVPRCRSDWIYSASGTFYAEATDAAGHVSRTAKLTYSIRS